jgi:hypothetical protein
MGDNTLLFNVLYIRIEVFSPLLGRCRRAAEGHSL